MTLTTFWYCTRTGSETIGEVAKATQPLKRVDGESVVGNLLVPNGPGDPVGDLAERRLHQVNARLQTLANQLEGPIEFLSDEEGKRATVTNRGTVERPWELWKKKAMAL